ncbi:MAG: ZIP family metal transporter [Candidatus Nanoarchaeia archaeon]|nr:ZIP family metal transporter [Candidatus Nanoarchaeia archaeon]
MNPLILILLSTFLVSLISFIGVITLALKEDTLKKITFGLVALSAGALMGGAFLHLIPEALEKTNLNVFIIILISFIIFFIIEKILHWRHCHETECKVHTFAHMSIFGDSIHNFIDGLIIAGSFMVNTPLGVTTMIAVIIHEIPQEMGDFGVLIHGGIKKTRALFLNFVSALTAILGGIIGFLLSNRIEGFIGILLAFAAGGFIYISASDLVPEIRKEIKISRSLLVIGLFIVGIMLMYLLKFIIKF